MPVTKKITKGFALEIIGDEMVAPDSPVRVGGHVAFDVEAEPQSGDAVLVIINDNETPLFRQLRVSGGRHLLRPLNAQYSAIETDESGYQIIAVAKQFITDM